MIEKLTVVNSKGDRTTIDIRNPWETGLVIHNISGLTAGKADITTQAKATMDGVRVTNKTVPSRNIVITAYAYDPLDDIERVRHNAYQLFPLKSELEFIFESPHRTASIKGHIEDVVSDLFVKQAQVQISIVCDFPFFNSLSVKTREFYFTESLFEFPFEDYALEFEVTEKIPDNNINFGEITILQEANVHYDGEMPVGAVFKIAAVGSVVNPRIINTYTRETLYIDTSKIQAQTGTAFGKNDILEISTVKSQKYARLLRAGYYTNVFNCIDRKSSWITLTTGDNMFAFDADSGKENIRLTIEHHTLYGGL